MSPAQVHEEEMRLVQFKEMQGFVTRTVKQCFTECVSDFNTSSLSQQETQCLNICISRTLTVQNEVESILPMIDTKFKD